MANELNAEIGSFFTGMSPYFRVWCGIQQLRNDGDLETYVAGNYDHYVITATEDAGVPGRFVGDMPSGSPAGHYGYDLLLPAGASPAAGDSVLAASGEVGWLGTSVPLPVKTDASGNAFADVTHVNGSTTAAQALAARNFSAHADGVVVVADAATDLLRATTLLAAYTAAKALTPGGNALSSSNRVTVLVPPGRYDFALGDGTNHGLLLDAPFIDLVGMTGDPDDVVLTSQITAASRGTVEQTANDVHIKNVTMNISAGSAVGNGGTLASAYYPNSNLPLTRIEDCRFRTGNAAYGYPTRLGAIYSGKYERCRSYDDYFFSGFLSGLFIDIVSRGVYSLGGGYATSGIFMNCYSTGANSLGNDSGSTGVFMGCVGPIASFYPGSAAVYINCSRGGAILDTARSDTAGTTTLLARLGAFTGTGWNTILGCFRAALRKDSGVTLPTDIGGTFDNTTDSAEALRDRGDAAWLTATSTIASNLPTDYQQRGQAVTLPSTAPSGWGLSSTGSGARTITVTVTDGTSILESARVRLVNGSENYVGTTNASGVVVFSLDDKTWAVAITNPGYLFTPTTLVVTANASVSYAMTAEVIPSSDAGFVTGYWYCYDNAGDVQEGVVVQLVLTSSPGSGIVYDAAVRQVTSDSNGLATFTNLTPGATYQARRGIEGNWTTDILVALTATSPYALGSLLGEDD